MRQPRALMIARWHWAKGDPAPLDIELAIIALGFDLTVLEARYRWR
jgi:hypothetical protein